MGAGSNLTMAFIFFNKFDLVQMLLLSSFLISVIFSVWILVFVLFFLMSGSCIAILNSKMKLSDKVHKLKSSAADEINIISIDFCLKIPRKMLWSKKETKYSLDNACCKQS